MQIDKVQHVDYVVTLTDDEVTTVLDELNKHIPSDSSTPTVDNFYNLLHSVSNSSTPVVPTVPATIGA